MQIWNIVRKFLPKIKIIRDLMATKIMKKFSQIPQLKIFKNFTEKLNQQHDDTMQTEPNTNYENSTTKIQINDKGTEIQKERKVPDYNDLQNKKSKEKINNWKDIRKFSIIKIHSSYKEFNSMYPFVSLKGNEAETYLSIDMSEYDKLRWKELEKFNDMCKEVYLLDLALELQREYKQTPNDFRRKRDRDKLYKLLCDAGLNDMEIKQTLKTFESSLFFSFDGTRNMMWKPIPECSKRDRRQLTKSEIPGSSKKSLIPNPNLPINIIKNKLIDQQISRFV